MTQPTATAPHADLLTAGWQPATYRRSTLTEQYTLEHDGFLASVAVSTDGAVMWNVQHLDAKFRSMRGTTEQVDAAVAAVNDALASTISTLF